MHVVARNLSKAWRRVHLDLETEMPGIEFDRSIHVVDDVAETRGHGPTLLLHGLANTFRTYPFHSETSTSHKWEWLTGFLATARSRRCFSSRQRQAAAR